MMTNQSEIALEHAVKGKVIYLLALIALVQFAYPVTAYGETFLTIYVVLYASISRFGHFG
jgi:hypothetical protein